MHTGSFSSVFHSSQNEYSSSYKNSYRMKFLVFVPRPARGGGARGAKYLGPGLVRGPEVLVKRLVIGATVKRVGGP